jgi:hypothetical protein
MHLPFKAEKHLLLIAQVAALTASGLFVWILGDAHGKRERILDPQAVSAVIIQQCGLTKALVLTWEDRGPQIITMSMTFPSWKLNYLATGTRTGYVTVVSECHLPLQRLAQRGWM